VVPLGVGIGLGAGFDWLAVTGLGRAAMRYYGPGGPGARPLLLAPENPSHVETRGLRDLVEPALLRRLVGAPPHKARGMAKALTGLELVVCDLTHQLGTDGHPLRVLASRPAAQATRHAARVRPPLLFGDLGLEWLQLLDQLLSLGGAEGRRVPDVVDRALLVVQTEQESAKG